MGRPDPPVPPSAAEVTAITELLPERTDEQPASARRRYALLTRSKEDRLITGVAGGIGERLGLDPLLIRVGFVVLASAAGAGLAAYLLAWVASHEPGAEEPTAPHPPPPTVAQTVAFVAVLFGLLLLLRDGGIWLADAITWPLALVSAGSVALWTHGDAHDRDRLQRFAARIPGATTTTLFSGRATLGRLAVGGLLLVGGLATFLATSGGVPASAIGPLFVGMAITVVGLAVLVGPWGLTMVRQLSHERVARARSQERAELAAHLHDSVLQTLALIQRSDNPREMATLARTQERDLRGWLFGTGGNAGTLRAAVEEAAAGVEERHHVPVDVVVVGDTALDEPLRAIVQAAAEAMSNAARHAHADRISVYAEADDTEVVCYVTDQGVGFDPSAVPEDRLGIAESIRGRMARHGGKATILTGDGEGTEVELRMPRAAS